MQTHRQAFVRSKTAAQLQLFLCMSVNVRVIMRGKTAACTDQANTMYILYICAYTLRRGKAAAQL